MRKLKTENEQLELHKHTVTDKEQSDRVGTMTTQEDQETSVMNSTQFIKQGKFVSKTSQDKSLS